MMNSAVTINFYTISRHVRMMYLSWGLKLRQLADNDSKLLICLLTTGDAIDCVRLSKTNT